MADEGVREIQLDGKQLVFLFMAATVVAVVIFLCGVMVGRGVPVRAATDAQSELGLDPTAQPQETDGPVSTPADGPVAANEELSYNELLGRSGSPVETLNPASESADLPAAEPVSRRAVPGVSSLKPAAAVSPVTQDVPAPRPPVPTAAAARGFTEPRGNGYVVQVAAVPRRDEANAIARRLNGKGYPAFVTTSGSNFRVRVGKYSNRREAETVANRLEREERIEPWVTR